MADPGRRYTLNPGPLIPDVLFLHEKHRAARLFHNAMPDRQLQVRRCDYNFWMHVPHIPERVMCHIRDAGFEGVIRCGYVKLDHALITALVERWRPETHTFHFPIGEATITLQDVEVLWGLSIDGAPVICTDWNHKLEQWVKICEDFLGFTPPEGAITHNRIQLSCFDDVLSAPLPNDASEIACIQRARVYILYLLGGHLLADSSSSCVYLHHLNFFTGNMVSSGIMSWGSAILACLYRRLCKATSPDATEISGPLLLLQLWAWERFPTIRPIRRNDEIDFTRLYGARWDVNFSLSRAPMHVLSTYRDQLASLRPDQFIWLPYSADVLATLPPYCTHGQASWRCVTYLICWEIVEPHLPNRVMRQFGLHQPIPVPRLLENHDKLHKMTRSGRFGADWTKIHRVYYDHWLQRHNHVENGTVGDDIGDVAMEYMSWYWQRTVIYITNPGSAVQFAEGFQGDGFTAQCLMDGMCRLFYLSSDFMAGASDARNAGYFSQIRDLTSHYMSLARSQQRLEIKPSHVLEQVNNRNAHPTENVQREARNPKRRQGGRRQRCPTSDGGQQCDAQNTEVGGSSSNVTQPTDFVASTSEMHTTPPHLIVHSTMYSPVPLPAIEEHVPVDEDVPLARRRPKRTIKPPTCGTH